MALGYGDSRLDREPQYVTHRGEIQAISKSGASALFKFDRVATPVWLPISQVEADCVFERGAAGEFTVPWWLAKKEGLDI